ncbi:MAG: fluoride efflux transporter CrcB [Flavobacteriales bacterium]
MNLLAVFIGGGLGSLARYGISCSIPKHMTNFPLATFLSNLLACILLAFIVKLSFTEKIDSRIVLLAATGFCGGFSTFSTFSLENIKLIQDGMVGMALLNAIVSIVVCGLAMHFILSK